jgi:single-stranded-DNA-specific exonuclease
MISFKARQPWSAAKEKAASEIAAALGLEKASAALLVLRGMMDAEDAREFLNPSVAQFHDPFAFEDMGKAVRMVEDALSNKKKITVYSDYDADGTSAAACLYLYLKDKGADIGIYTPHRHREGYGMNCEAVAKIASEGTALLISVDCGITNTEEVKAAKESGLDVIVLDHHECPEALPAADAIINPKIPGSSYPFHHLCGAGIALKLVEALGGRDAAMKLIDLAALGTIADIVPLLGENRAIAALGLQKMRKKPATGIRLLAEAADIDLKRIEARSVSFGLAPRINAASRMDDARLAVRLLTSTEEDEEALDAAAALCEHNKVRQQVEEGIYQEAHGRVSASDLMDGRALLLMDEGWNTGVIGIVASKLLEEFYRPVILFGAENGNYVGSARSTDEVNIHEALSRFSDLFLRFGGHFHAAGLTIPKENLPELKKGLNEYLKSAYPEESFLKKSVYDMELALSEINAKLLSELKLFAPFGQENPPALFKIAGAKIHAHSYVGKTAKDHLRFTLEEDGHRVNAICFNHIRRYCFLSGENEYIASAEMNDFDLKPQLQVTRIKPKSVQETFDAYLRSLKKDFALNFPDAVRCMDGSFDSGDAFIESLGRDLEASRFGTLVLFDTEEGFCRALRFPAVRDALTHERLEIPCENSSREPTNALVGMAGWDEKLTSRYQNIYCIGGFAYGADFSCRRYFDEELRAAYRARAKKAFSDREKLLLIHKKLQALAGKEGEKALENAEAAAKELNVPIEKAAFALKVFCELGLIDCANNGKIQFKTVEKGKRDLMESGTFAAFINLTEGQ